MQRGTKIFVAARTQECSTFPRDDCDGTRYPQLIANARALDAKYTTHTVAVDGKAVSVSEVVTGLLHVVLPDPNVFDLPGGTSGLSAAHGWVVQLNALSVGTHTIDIHLAGQGFDTTVTTTIYVRRRFTLG